MKVYYAHPRGTYNTELELAHIAMLEALGFEVLNPNQPIHQRECLKRDDVMSYFEDLVRTCDALAYTTFVDAMIGAGCVREIRCAESDNKPVIELPHAKETRYLTVKETQEHQPQIYGE